MTNQTQLIAAYDKLAWAISNTAEALRLAHRNAESRPEFAAKIVSDAIQTQRNHGMLLMNAVATSTKRCSKEWIDMAERLIDKSASVLLRCE